MSTISSTSPTRLRPSVNAFCKSCIYDRNAGAGSWRKQVANCRSFSCPLFNVRPGNVTARGVVQKSQDGEKIDQISAIPPYKLTREGGATDAAQ